MVCQQCSLVIPLSSSCDYDGGETVYYHCWDCNNNRMTVKKHTDTKEALDAALKDIKDIEAQ